MPKVVIAAFRFPGLLPQIVGAGADVFLVWLHRSFLQVKREGQKISGEFWIADPPDKTPILLGLGSQFCSLIHG